MAALPLKHFLEDLLRQRRLQPEMPPLTGEDRCLRALPTGLAAVDAWLGGGFPRGEISHLGGPPSSGRTALALTTAAGATRDNMLVAWIDAADQFHPASATACGVELSRLFWLRGRAGELKRLFSATATVLGSGLFDLVVLDLVGSNAREHQALPHTTGARLQRLIAGTPTAVLLLGDTAIGHSPGGLSLELLAAQAFWKGRSGTGRLLTRLHGSVRKSHGRGGTVPFVRGGAALS